MRWIVACLLFAAPFVSVAQTDTRTHEVYVERQAGGNGEDRLIFLDLISGETSDLTVTGERYTVVQDQVYYWDYENRRMMIVDERGAARPHPFMQPEDLVRRIDWITSREGREIAWTVTRGTSDALVTNTFVASADGSNLQEVLSDGPRNGTRALPVAFRTDNSALVMDNHPDGLERFLPHPQYAGLFEVSLETQAIQPLPGEPSCFCGAGLRSDQLIRLVTGDAPATYQVNVIDLDTGFSQTIPAAQSGAYTLAGNVLISPDGSRAVYALSNIRDFGTLNQSVETVFMLIDLQSLTQSQLTDTVTTYLHPVQWTEDNSAVLFTSPQENGTWKVFLSDGELIKVSDASYIGTLRAPS